MEELLIGEVDNQELIGEIEIPSPQFEILEGEVEDVELIGEVEGTAVYIPGPPGIPADQTWEPIVLDSQNIIDQAVDLQNLAIAGSIFLFVNGIAQFPGYNYEIENGVVTKIRFRNDLATGGLYPLTVGQIIHFNYRFEV